MATELRVLGAVQVLGDGTAIAIDGRKPRRLLAALMLNADRVVSTDRLVEALWDDEPPRSALENLRTYATSLRKGLSRAGSAVELTTSRSGFLMRIGEARLDLDSFRSSVGAARYALAGGDPAAAVSHYSEALLFWRGPAGEGLARDGWLGAALAALDDQHLAVVEERAEAQLLLGQHRDVVPQLARLTTEHPLRERLWRLLILAQYRNGELSDALASHAKARSALAEQLGVDPSPEFAALHTALLRRDPALEAPAADAAPVVVAAEAADVPRQLPARSAGFAGRTAELAEIAGALRATSAGAPVAVNIHGPAGLGSSALALQAAHQAAGDFPDGQLYLDLGTLTGTDDERACEAAARLLRGLGATGPAPRTAAEAGAMVRSELAGRRVLMLIDNAGHASSVAVLLPAQAPAAAIVTSLAALELPGITHDMPLGPLDHASAVRILADAVGAGRAAAERHALGDIARLCSGIPVALRAAATRLAARSNWSAGTTRDRLACEKRRLAELSFGRASVRASLAMTLAGAAGRGPAVRRVFAQLSRCEAPFDVDTARQACREPVPDLAAALEQLVDFGLLDTVAPEHYRFPELTRLFAVEQLENADTAEL